MSYEPRTYVDDLGEPTVVLVVHGQHEVVGLIAALESQVGTTHVGTAIREQIGQIAVGVKTLRLLREVSTDANR